MTVLMLVMPTSNADALPSGESYCKRSTGTFISINSTWTNPGSVYLSEAATGYVRISANNGYSFDRRNGSNYATRSAYDSYIGENQVVRRAVGKFITIDVFRISIPSFDIKVYSDTSNSSCWVNVGSQTAEGTVNKPENIDLSWSVSGGRAWNDPVTVTFRVTNKDGSGPTPTGEINFDYSGIREGIQYDRIPINGVRSVTIPSNVVSFSAFDRGCRGGSIWDFVFGGNILYCSSTWFGTQLTPDPYPINQSTKFLTGHNAIAYVEFITGNRYIWNGGSEANPWNPGDKAESIWQMNSPTQSSNLFGTASSNTSGIPNVSKAGTIEKNIPRINKSCVNSSTCDGWKPYTKYSNGSYAWYALRANNFSYKSSGNIVNSAFFLNCEPEGNGRVSFQYYDYGQGVYDPYMYKQYMMNNKGQSFNLKDPAHGLHSVYETGILGGFDNYNSASNDRWDIILPATNPWGEALSTQQNFVTMMHVVQRWGGGTAPSCVYPSPRAWLPSTTTMTLPSSQFINGRYIFSTAMPVSLGSLDVRGGSGADNRTLPANPVTIQIRGPINRDVNVYCLSSANPSNCVRQAVTRLTTAGDYTIRACWNGGVTGGGVHRIFTGSCSGTISFRVYETFSCDFPETPANNITIGPDAQGQVFSGVQGGTPQIVRSGDKIRVTYPNVTLANFKGLVSVPSPPAGEPQIKGRTRIADGSNPTSSSDVRLYDASGREIDPGRGNSLEWNDGIEIANPVHFISYYWPSAITASGRASIQIERRIWVYATAFDPAKGATAPPDTQYWSCSSVGSRDIPHSAWIQIINSQLNQ